MYQVHVDIDSVTKKLRFSLLLKCFHFPASFNFTETLIRTTTIAGIAAA